MKLFDSKENKVLHDTVKNSKTQTLSIYSLEIYEYKGRDISLRLVYKILIFIFNSFQNTFLYLLL